MIFECPDGLLCRILAVRVGGCQLKLDLKLLEFIFESITALVVQMLQFWVEPSLGESFLEFAICSDDFVLLVAFNGFHKDGVAVVVIESTKTYQLP